MPLVTIKNEEIFYHAGGDVNSQNTLLFIHGASSNHSSFRILEAKLSSYNYIFIDLPCHGQSKGSMRKNVESYADFIQDFILTLQEEGKISQDVTLIGCSMGGFISIELAIRNFAPVKRFITISSGPNPGSHSKIIPYLDESAPETFDAKPLIRKSFSPHCTEQHIKSLMKLSPLPENEVCYYDFSTVKYFEKLDQVKEITIPALAIIGDSDEIIPPICSFQLRENMPSCNLAIVPFLGHTMILDVPDYISNLIVNFVSANSK